MAGKTKPAPNELTFWDHVEELRIRLIRGLVYIGAGACVAWLFRGTLLYALEYPALEGVRRANIQGFNFRIFEPAGGFLLMIQIALATGVVLTVPLLGLELWGFLSPALKPNEKRWVLWAVPGSTALFLAGVATCYWIAPKAFAFLLGFTRSMGVQPELTLAPYLFFFVRLLLAFGALFQLPLILMLLAALGFVNSQVLLSQWRWAITIIAVVAAVATPTPDAFTMIVCAMPMVGLYFVSVLLVRFVERPRKKAEPADEGGDGDRPGETRGGPPSGGNGKPGGGDGPSGEAAPEVDIDEIYRRLNEENAGLDR